jgi:hypothetical protein
MPVWPSMRFRGTGDWNIRRRSTAALVRFDVGCPDHLAPLLGFIGDELAEFGGRHRQWNATQVCEPLLDLRIGEAGGDLSLRKSNSDVLMVQTSEVRVGQDAANRLNSTRGWRILVQR